MKKKLFCGLALIMMLGFSFSSKAQNQDFFDTQAQRLEWFRDAKFGMFIHWGPVSLTGREIGWSRGGERRGRPGTGQTPLEIYDNLYKHWNPSLYNAEEWVQVARAAGMKYMVFTTKHHDGFCNWDTEYTEYKSTAEDALFGRDIVKELAEACHKHDMPLGFYYSLPDWYDENFLTDKHDQFLEMMHGQVRELLTRYGKIDVMWFDLGGMVDEDGSRSCDPAIWDAGNLINMVHELQPGAVVNNRTCLAADFGTPEQRIGAFQSDPAWETCMTIGRQWAWKPKDDMKSKPQCIQTLIRAAGGDGNLLFNVGPMPDGRIEPRQVDRIKEMGEWLDKYGETIYGTRGGPYKPTDWGVSTRNGNKIFVHLLNWFGDSPTLRLPLNGVKIRDVSLLTGGEINHEIKGKDLLLNVSKYAINEIDAIIQIEIEGDAMDIPVTDVNPESLSYQKSATASSESTSHFWKAGNVLDGDWTGHGWRQQGDEEIPWIEVDLGGKMTVSRMIIFEDGNSIEEFDLQVKTRKGWSNIHNGQRIGDKIDLTFDPVKGQVFRLSINKANGKPSIREMVLL
ncbi:MAG: alpha-L-fucosidase [Bacteroidales bacterium]